MVTEDQLLAALRVLVAESVGDFAYDIHGRVLGDPEWPAEQSTWEHPRVKSWSDASMVITQYVREHPEQPA